MNNELKKKIDGYVGNFLIRVGTLFIRNRPSSDAGNILKDPKRILLIKFWGIGNLIMLTPAMKAIRKKFPKSEICFLTLSKNKGLLENLDYIDKVIYYELGSLDIMRINRLISKYYRKFDVVVDFEQFLNISSIIAYFLGKYRIGFSNKTRARHKLYNYVKPCSSKTHMVEQFYGLCEVLGIKKKNLELENFNFIEKSEIVDSFLNEKGAVINKKGDRQILIGMHAASSENAEAKRWPKHHFIELMNILNKKLDNLVFVMSGIESERNYVDSITKKIDKGNCYNSCGIFNLRDLIYFMKKCDLFISNDTGPIHIAAACGVTSIGLYGPTSPALYGPYGKNHAMFYKGVGCSPCVDNYNAKSTNCRDPFCMKDITPEEVANRILRYVKEGINSSS